MRACLLRRFSQVWLFATPWILDHQAPLSMGFSRQEYWSGLPFASPECLPNTGIEPESPALQVNFFFFFFLLLSHPGSHSFNHESESESHSVVSNSLWPHGLHSPWNSPGRNTGVGSLSLLQGIFPTQGSNPGLLHCRQIFYQLSHKGSTGIPEWVAYPCSSGSSWPRNQTGVLCIADGFFTNWAIKQAHIKAKKSHRWHFNSYMWLPYYIIQITKYLHLWKKFYCSKLI